MYPMNFSGFDPSALYVVKLFTIAYNEEINKDKYPAMPRHP